MIIRSFITPIQLTKRQEKAMVKHCIATRILYNETIAWSNRRYRMELHGKSFPETGRKSKDFQYNDFDNKFPWMKECNACVRRAAVDDATDAFKKFFKGLSDFPRFKSKKSPLKCRNLQSNQIKLLSNNGNYSNLIRVGLIGTVKLLRNNYVPLQRTITKTISGGKDKPIKQIEATNIIQVAFSKRSSKWYASISMYVDNPITTPLTKETIGIDIGCRVLAYSSNGNVYQLTDEQKINITSLEHKIARWNQTLSRRFKTGQKIQSKNYYEAKDKLAKYHKALADMRADTIHKVSNRIVAGNPQKIIVEDLSIANMLKNRKLAPTISKVGLYKFKECLLYKANTNGIKCYKISRWYPSSLRCSGCGNRKTKKELGSKINYQCDKCKLNIHRDFNAAKNIAAVSQKDLTEI